VRKPSDFKTAPTSTWNLHGINFSIIQITLNKFSNLSFLGLHTLQLTSFSIHL